MSREIALSVDPNVSNDVCTFCKHANFAADRRKICDLGYESYFRGFSNVGWLYVSDCRKGELSPKWAARERKSK